MGGLTWGFARGGWPGGLGLGCTSRVLEPGWKRRESTQGRATQPEDFLSPICAYGLYPFSHVYLGLFKIMACSGSLYKLLNNSHEGLPPPFHNINRFDSLINLFLLFSKV